VSRLAFVLLLLLPLPASAAEPVTLRGHKHTVTCLAFSRDGKVLASGSKDGTARLWNVAERKTLFVLDGHKDMAARLVQPRRRRPVVGRGDRQAAR
jgi:WD40 repeat protein